jgi:hypothetical protein
LDEVIPTLKTEIKRLLDESRDRAVTMVFPETSFDASS